MKKKIAIGLLVISAFFIGKYSETEYNKTCDVMDSIVDWNTNGEEISIMTKSGLEYYAYNKEDIYK